MHFKISSEMDLLKIRNPKEENIVFKCKIEYREWENRFSMSKSDKSKQFWHCIGKRKFKTRRMFILTKVVLKNPPP